MSVTIRMIAKKMALAIGTVSQALRNDSRIAESTRAEVIRVANEMGYVPSDLGRALSSGKSCMVGYFLSDITKSFYGNIMKGISEEATRNKYGVLFTAPSNTVEGEVNQIKYFEQKRVEGIIISGCEPETWNYLDKLNRNGIPVIVSGNYTKKKGIEEIVTDDFSGGKIAANHLIGLGHTRMAYYNSTGLFNYRQNGFFDEIKKRKMLPPLICESKDALQKLLTQKNRPTAVLAYKDLDAVDVIDIAEFVGLRVPDDLSVIGYNDDVYSSFKKIGLTTLGQQKDEIGRLSFINLLRKINGEKIRNILLKPELIIRSSTSILKKGGVFSDEEK